MQTPASRALALRTNDVTYSGSAEHIRTVRADLRAVLGECPMAEDVILCASELAANAAIHSHSRLPGGTFTVRATISPGDYAWIEVEDNGGPWTPAMSGPAPASWTRNRPHPRQRLGHRRRPHHPYHLGKIQLARLMMATRHTNHAQRWIAVVDGHRLRELRRQRGLAREELAGRAGISLDTLARLERRQSASCRTRTLARLAAALGEEPSAIALGVGQHTG